MLKRYGSKKSFAEFESLLNLDITDAERSQYVRQIKDANIAA